MTGPDTERIIRDLPSTEPDGIPLVPVPVPDPATWFAQEHIATAKGRSPNRSRRDLAGAIQAAAWLLSNLPEPVGMWQIHASADDGVLHIVCHDQGSAARIAHYCGLTVTIDRAEPDDPHVRYCRWDGTWADQQVRVDWKGIHVPGAPTQSFREAVDPYFTEPHGGLE